MTPARITSLPPEILLSVLPFLDIKDLKSVRQCDRLLAEEGARWLFQTLLVYFLRSSFERLWQISRHEIFRLYVRRIYYVANRFVPGLSMDQWRHHYSKSDRGEMNNIVWLRKPYRCYREIADEQCVGHPSLSLQLTDATETHPRQSRHRSLELCAQSISKAGGVPIPHAGG
jgi:hypothetical protein